MSDTPEAVDPAPTIRVVWGTGRGPTEVAAYDAALADANVHNFNLVHVSSIVPAGTAVTAVGDAPELGSPGDRLTVVEGSATGSGPGTVAAGLGWSTGEGPGLFYEAAGTTDRETVRGEIEQGLEAGRRLRNWPFEDTQVRTVSIEAEAGEYATATVLAVYGTGDPIL